MKITLEITSESYALAEEIARAYNAQATKSKTTVEKVLSHMLEQDIEARYKEIMSRPSVVKQKKGSNN
jgi:hypothetical protein